MRSGKDSVGDILMEELSNVRRVDITSYLKRGVAKMLDITPKAVDELKDKAEVIITEINNEGEVITLSKISIRRILQYQADINRQYITCEKAMEELMSKDRDYYLLTGVRLPDEVELIKRLHADKRVIALKVIRNDFEFESPDKKHKTETLVDLIKEDYLIKAVDMEELENEVQKFIKYLH